MSLETFVNVEVKFMKENLQKYHKVMDYLLGFLDESQWQQALEEALKEDHLDYSIMEQVFEDYVEDWSIDTKVDEVILKACYNVRKEDQNSNSKYAYPTDYETIIRNLEAKKD